MLQFEYNGSSYQVTGQIEPFETDIEIPAEYDDGFNGLAPVTIIGNDVFQSNQLTTVTIPNSVTSIGNRAFQSNQLTSVTIPGSVTSIGSNAFSYNQLTSVTIPDSVMEISVAAFRGNQLTSVAWETAESVPGYAFSGGGNTITSFTITSDILISLLDINAFDGVTAYQPMTVYVQPHLIEEYKVATNWSDLYNQGKIIFFGDSIPEPEPKDFREVGNIYLDSFSKTINKVSLVTEDTINRIKNQEESSEKNVLYLSNKKSTIITDGDGTKYLSDDGTYKTPDLDIEDSLTSVATDKALSANQGRVLNEKVESIKLKFIAEEGF